MFAKLFMDLIVKLHGVPQRIISDRDKRFNNAYFKAVCDALKIDLAMSTAYHPQTDGQTERVNRVLQEMLRHYVYHRHHEWVEGLPFAEFAINNSIHTSTGHTPFYLNYGEHPSTPETSIIPQAMDVPAAADTIEKLKDALEIARAKMEEAQKHQAYYANSSRREQTFQQGDKVLVRTANYLDRMRRKEGSHAATRLLPKFIGPYEITHKYSDLVYQVKLPPQWSNIYNVFYVSQLSPYRTSQTFPSRERPPVQRPPLIRQEMSGDRVRAIHGRRYDGYDTTNGHRCQYLVEWEGQGTYAKQWVSSWTIKVAGRQHPLVTKFNTQVPFIQNEPQLGAHEPPSVVTALLNKGNVSEGMTIRSPGMVSRRKLPRIPCRGASTRLSIPRLQQPSSSSSTNTTNHPPNR